MNMSLWLETKIKNSFSESSTDKDIDQPVYI